MKAVINCVFCQIVEKKIPCYKVYEDKQFLAFLDINPSSLGHTLVIPKKHFRWVYDVPNFGEYFEVAKKVALALKEATGVSSIRFLTLGEMVPHAHIHVVPQFDGPDVIKFERKMSFSPEKMTEIAEKIGQNVIK